MDWFVTPLARPMLRSALVTAGLLGSLAMVAGAIRLLPWVVDPPISWPTLWPFARSLAALACEVSMAIGWPIGCALEALQSVERGEWLALQAVGERPSTALARLAPQGLVMALVFALIGATWGRDNDAPGRVVDDLLAESRAACVVAAQPRTYSVPFVDAVWLCVPGQEPRLVAHPPGAFAAQLVTARSATVSPDVRRIELGGARARIGTASIRAERFVIEGLVPWGRPTVLPSMTRALVLAVSTVILSFLAALGTVRWPPGGRLATILLGASGPLTALAVLRHLERQGSAIGWFVLVPSVGCLVTMGAGYLLSRLPQPRLAASR